MCIRDSPQAGRQLREFLLHEVMEPAARATGVPDPELRATAVVAQPIGVGLLRYVVPQPPLREETHDAIDPLIATTIQRYLVGDDG